MRKDKEKVIGEPMTDEQVAVFLQARPYTDLSRPARRGFRALSGDVQG